MDKRIVEKVKVERVASILENLMSRQVPYETAFYILELNMRVKTLLKNMLKGNVTVDVTPLGTFEYVKFKNVTVTPEELQAFMDVFAVVKAERIVE